MHVLVAGLAFAWSLVWPSAANDPPTDSRRAAPTIYRLLPTSTFVGQYPEIDIEYCDDESLNTAGATVRVNGVIVTSSFGAWAPSQADQCGPGEVFVHLNSSTVSMNLGDNELRTRMCDNGNNCTTQIWTLTRVVPSPPAIAIVSPTATGYTRTPLVLATYQAGGSEPGAELNMSSLSVMWGDSNVTTQVRRTSTLLEWEVTPNNQIGGAGQSKVLSITLCNTYGTCTTQNRTVSVASSPHAIVSVTSMPLEALGSLPTAPLGGGWSLHGAEIVTSLSATSYTSRNVARTAGLSYSSRQSYPRALVQADLEFPGGLPSSLTVKLWDGGTVMDQWTQSSPSCSTSGVARCRVALRAEYLGGGGNTIFRKWLRIEALATISGSVYSSVDSVEVVIVDRRNTPYGSGWWPTGMLRLITAGSDAILVSSDGSATVYRGSGSKYISPMGSRDTLVQLSSTWELRFVGGSKLVFDNQGRLTQVLPPGGLAASQRFTYLSYDEVDSIIDPQGKGFRFTYGSGILNGIVDAGGRTSSVTISSSRLTGFAPPAASGQNYSVSFGWNATTGNSVRPIYSENASGHRDSVSYYGSTNEFPYRVQLRSVPNESGTSIYPDSRFISSAIQGLAGTFSIDTARSIAIDGRSNVSYLRHNRWGQVLHVWDAIDTVAFMRYSPDGRLLMSAGRQSDSTRDSTRYDATGRMVSRYRRGATGSWFRTDSLEFDSDGRVGKTIDTFGNWTLYRYSAFGTPDTIISSLGDTTINRYKSNGQLDSTRVPGEAGWTRILYDTEWGNTYRVRAPDGTYRGTTSYDSYSRISGTTRKITIRVTSSGTQMQLRGSTPYYREATNLVDSIVTMRSADCTGDCESATWPNQSDTLLVRVIGRRYSYLGRDSLRTIRVGSTMQVQEEFLHDALGRVRVRRRPTSTGSMAADSFRYDAAGNLRYHVTRRGYTLETRFDARNRPVQRIIPTVGTDSLYYNGPNDELTAIRAFSGYADAVGGSSLSASWVYDQSGRLIADTVQSSRTNRYYYDGYNRLDSLRDDIGLTDIRFNATRGSPDSVVTPYGDRIVYTTDTKGRLNGPKVSGLSVPFERRQVWSSRTGLAELYNEVGIGATYWVAGRNQLQQDGNPSTSYDSLAPEWHYQTSAGSGTTSLRDTLAFNGLRQLIAAQYWLSSTGSLLGADTLQYDSRANLSIGGSVWSFSTAGNHLTAGAGCTFLYDVSGNLTQKTCSGSTTTYTYDALERLVGVSFPGGTTASYTYDVQGQRIAKNTSSEGVLRFIWRNAHVTYETNSGGTIQRSYSWGASTDDLIAVHDHVAGQRFYVVQDALRSVRALARSDGVWAVGYRYGAYGIHSAFGTEPFTLRFRWTGAQYDAETGFYYLRSRLYSPDFGRFVSEDRIGYSGGSNLYGYGDGDPSSNRDPNGTSVDEDMQYKPRGASCWNRDCSPAWTRGEAFAGFDSWALLTSFEQNVTFQEYLDAHNDAKTQLDSAYQVALSPLTMPEFGRVVSALNSGPSQFQTLRWNIVGGVLEAGLVAVDRNAGTPNNFSGLHFNTATNGGRAGKVMSFEGDSGSQLWVILHPGLLQQGPYPRQPLLRNVLVHEGMHWHMRVYGSTSNWATDMLHMVIYGVGDRLSGHAVGFK